MLTTEQQDKIRTHALKEYDWDGRECCGYIYKSGRIKTEINKAAENDLDPTTNFVLSPDRTPTWDKILAVYHSHTNGNNKFTPADARACKTLNIPLILYDVIGNQFKYLDPTGGAPYLGREFCYGLYDCYSLVRDYYANEFDIILDDFERFEVMKDGILDWNLEGWDRFVANYPNQGFIDVDRYGELKHGDILLMQIGGAKSANHVALVTDPIEGIFIHQLYNQPSCQAVYGSPWDTYTIKVLRHQKLC
jgi:cell wall-associated NlpC family hydrolase